MTRSTRKRIPGHGEALEDSSDYYIPATKLSPRIRPLPENPVVAVIIPAYNAERYLLETAHSVLAQTFSRLELIIVDDGSTDSTLAIARAITDPRVKVLSGPNRGRSAARNSGLAALHPAVENVAFLDADDLWEPRKLERQVEWLRVNTKDCAVGCAMHYVSSHGRRLGRTGMAVDDEAHERVRTAALIPFPVCASCLVRRTAVDAIGGFDPALSEAEDLDFLARLATIGSLGFISDPLGSYRIHGDSTSATRRARMEKSTRFVRARISARQAGQDLTWEAFSASYRPSLRQRRADLVRAWYRSAALAYADRNTPRLFAFASLAVLLRPLYTIRRLYEQKIRHRSREISGHVTS